MAPSIGDSALLSDCRTAALVAGDGSVVWWPAGRFDGPSPFPRLPGERAGHFPPVPAVAGGPATRRRHLEGTIVLESEWDAGGGANLRLTDALTFAPGARGHQIGVAPGGGLVRVAEAVGGDVAVRAQPVPRPEHGLVVPRVRRERGRLARLGGPQRRRVVDGGVLDPDGSRAGATFLLRAGESQASVRSARRSRRCDVPPDQRMCEEARA